MNRLGFGSISHLSLVVLMEILNQLRLLVHTGELGWMTHFAVGESTKFVLSKRKSLKKLSPFSVLRMVRVLVTVIRMQL